MGARLQALLDETVAAGDAPFVIAMTGDHAGATWSGVAGEAAPAEPARLDTLYRFYSMTKAVCATAAMILIDRGRLDMDAPAAEVLPEIGALQVLDGFDGATPRLRPPRRPITARHLATHTSGLAYDLGHEPLIRYLDMTGRPSYFTGKRAGLDYPLLFDPGDGWAYGTGLDWLGLMIERIDGRPIDRFCREEIFAPLGMPDTCFTLDEDRRRRLARFYTREPDGGFSQRDGRLIYNGGIAGAAAYSEDYDYFSMGACLFGTAPDYLRLLRMQLNGGELDGVRLVSEALTRKLQQNLAGEISVDFDWFPGPRKGHALPFMRVEEDTPGMRPAGSVYWAGGANAHYWIDFKTDLIGLFITHTAPFLDPRFMARFAAFERLVYADPP